MGMGNAIPSLQAIFWDSLGVPERIKWFSRWFGTLRISKFENYFFRWSTFLKLSESPNCHLSGLWQRSQDQLRPVSRIFVVYSLYFPKSTCFEESPKTFWAKSMVAFSPNLRGSNPVWYVTSHTGFWRIVRKFHCPSLRCLAAFTVFTQKIRNSPEGGGRGEAQRRGV